MESDEEHPTKMARQQQPHHDQGEDMMDRASLTLEELKQLLREARERLEDTTNDSEAENQRLEEVQEQVMEEEKRLVEIRKETEEMRKKREEIQKECKVLTNLGLGTYYATFDQVWDHCAVSFEAADYDAMIRDEIPTSHETLENNVSFPFRKTLEKAASPDFDAATDTKPSRPCESSSQPEQISRVRLTEARYCNRDDATKFILPSYYSAASTDSGRARPNLRDEGSPPSSPTMGLFSTYIGYLVPISSDLASLYHHVAIWVFGVKGHNHEPSFIQKLIHGSVPRPMPDDASVVIHREIGTGLKHMMCNNLRHPSLHCYFDKHPCLMIVPILSLQQAKEWRGQGYHALFIISTGDRNEAMGPRLQEVARKVDILDPGEVASEQDIVVAGELLTATIKGLAYSFVERSSITDNWVSALSDESREILEELRRNSTIVNTGDHRITVPIERRRPGNEKPIRKITFAPAFGACQHDGHLAPDPILLAVRAGLNWSTYHQEQMMMTAPPEEYYSDDDTTN